MPRHLITALLLTTAACTCGGPGTTGSDGIPDPDRTDLAFGRVRLSEAARIDVTLFNRGRARLRITGTEATGVPASFGLAQPPVEVAPDSSVKLQFTFAPESAGVASGTMVLLTDSAGTPRVEFHLTGEGVESKVAIEPEVLSFGSVEVGSRSTIPIVVTNNGLVREEVKLISAAEGSPHFRVGPVPGGGDTVTVEPGASAEVPVAFEPRFADPAGFVSTVEFLPCPSCVTRTVTLRGTGIDAFLTVTPGGCLDFGAVNPGTTISKPVTMSNLGTRPLAVLGAELSGSTDFSLVPPTTGSIDGGSDFLLTVSYHPGELGGDNATLRLSTDDPNASQVDLCVKGSGGGPDVSFAPDRLSFGTVSVGIARTRQLRIVNRGLSATGEPAVLVVSAATIQGSGGPFATTLAQPLSIDVGGMATLDVTYTPTAAGSHSGVLDLATNDPDSPVVHVALDGTARVLAPCQLETTPTTGTLAFGNVDRGRRAVLSFSLRNAGSEDCLVDMMRLSETSDAAFSFVQPPAAEITLVPGERRTFQVAFEPAFSRDFTGQVLFDVSNPESPHRTLALTGTSAKGCVLLSPDEMDFGTVGAACASRARTLTLYNSCTGSVRVTGLSLSPGSEIAFRLGTPDRALPAALTPSAPLRVDLRYIPPVLGEDVGGVYVQTDERTAPYLVPLMGRATADAIQRDSFHQDMRPAVDLLFVVDNSGSMSDNQEALAANFESFMKYATQQQINYRIAVTTTDTTASSGEGQGWFVPRDGSRARILTPNTPNVATVFGQNVKVGTNGSATEMGFEGAYKALNPTALQSYNTGFLRDDALLSVIVVTDETEQSPNPYAFYHSFFLSIKGARRSNLFSFSAVCITDPSDSMYDERYIRMAQETGGLSINIETSDWSRELERLGTLAFGRKTRFFLTSSPAAGETVNVYIDGQAVPATVGGITQWTIDYTANTIDFNPIAIPEPGSTLVVEYRVACGH